MEGVPRISMMSFPMRRSADNPNYKQKLKMFIRDHYNEDGESYSNEINELESLRAGAIHISKDVTGCSTLKKYFCQLNFLKSRFPLQEGGLSAVSFSWYDVYSETVHGWSDVDFEMSCILYNIGALHSELGVTDNRQTADGMKNACAHFQCAAWAFQHLRHNYQRFFTPDVSPDTLSIMTNVCLAQAQECILEKSLIDNKKSTITAKVALQIVEYYQLAMKTIDQMLKDASQYSDKVVKSVKKWRKLVELKVHYYDCLSLLYQGMQSEDDNKWGERVTFYKASIEKLNEAIKVAKSMDKTDNVHDTLQFTFDVVQGKVAISEKENEFVYHEKVPELNAVASDIKGVSLVKGIAFKFDDPQIAGPDIFGRLVPMEAHEASSLYSEEKAKVLRNYSSKIEEKNETLDKLLIALQLDQLDLHSTNKKVPQELVDCCAALSVNKDAVKKLSALMSQLSGMYHDVDGNLQEIHQLLKEEEKKEKDYQDIIGKRPPSNVITELSREVHKYQNAHTVAAETNQTLHDTLSKHVANLNILMKPFDEVLKYIPSLDDKGGMDEEAIHQMKRLISKVEEMRKQRIMLEQQLRDSIHSDDITKQLVIKKDQDLETVFQEELQKHEKITQILDQNLLAQENIMRALTEANANYAETRKATMEIVKRREHVMEELLSSYETYDELLAKCNKGIEFYNKLDINVGKLVQRVGGVCKVQEEERETSLKSLIRKTQVSSSNTIPGSGAYVPSELPSTMASGPLKLKDYLALMKGGQKVPNSDVNLQPTSPNDFSQQQHTPPQQYYGPSNTLPGQNNLEYDPTGQSYRARKDFQDVPNDGPGVRPAPVGSEDSGKSGANSNCTYGTYSGKGTLASNATSILNYPSTAVNASQYTYSSYPPTSVTLSYPAMQQAQNQYPQVYQSSQANYTNSNNISAMGSQHRNDYYSPQQPQQNQLNPQQQHNFQGQQQQNQSQQYRQDQPQQQQQNQPQQQQQNQSQQQQQNQPQQQQQNQPQQQQLNQPQQQQQNQPQQQQQHQNQPEQQQHQNQARQQLQLNQPQQQEQQQNHPQQQELRSTNFPQQYYNSFSPYNGSDGMTNTAYSYPAYSSGFHSAGIPGSIGVSMTSQSVSGKPHPSSTSGAMDVKSTASNHANYGQGLPNPHFSSAPNPQSYYTSSSHSIPASGFGSGAITSYPAGPSPAVPVNAYAQPASYQHAGNNSTSTIYATGTTPSVDGTNQSQTQTQGSEYVHESYLAKYVKQNQGYTAPTGSNSSYSGYGSSQVTGLGTYQQPQTYGTQSTAYMYDQSSAQQGQVFGQPGSSDSSGQISFSGYAGPNVQQNVIANERTAPQNYQYQNQFHPPQSQSFSSATEASGYYNNPQQQPNAGQSFAASAGSGPQQMQVANQNSMETLYQTPQRSNIPSTTAIPDVTLSKSTKISNVDLLTGIDLNTPPEEPLAPVLALKGPSNSTGALESTVSSFGGDLRELSASPSDPSQTTARFHSGNQSQADRTTTSSILQHQPKSSSIPDLSELLSSKTGHSSRSKPSIDHFADPVSLEKFTYEVEKFEKLIEGLNKRSLNGPTNLDLKWKELVDIQNTDSHKKSISVARCYPMKNRFPDILPFDQTRVPVPSTKDDYINASFITHLSKSAYLIVATQAPLPTTVSDFWQMIWLHQVELIVCLSSDIDIAGSIYWPPEKGEDLEFGPLKIVLQIINVRQNFVERTVTITHRELKQARVVIHLQFTEWTGHGFPVSPGPLIAFVNEVNNYYLQQRNLEHPVVIHCIAGVGKTGVFCSLSAALREIINGNGIPDVIQIAGKSSEQRKGIMNDKEYLRFTYHCLLYYCQDILMKRGILSAKTTFEEKPKKPGHIRHPSEDFVKDVSFKKQIKAEAMDTKETSSQIPTTSQLPTSPRHTNRDTDPAGMATTSRSEKSARYSDYSLDLTNVDASTFHINIKEPVLDPKAVARESFEHSKGGLLERKPSASSDDPLNSLDPLWTLKH